jgi:hypothetical protein
MINLNFKEFLLKKQVSVIEKHKRNITLTLGA